MKGESAARARIDEPDALEELVRHVSEAAESATAAPPPGVARGPRAARAPVPARAGVAVSGEAPNILSKQARHRLVVDSQRAAWFLLISAVAISVLGPVLAAFGDDDSGSTWWVLAAAALVVGGVTLWLVSYLTVMGFGKVSLSMNTASEEGTPPPPKAPR